MTAVMTAAEMNSNHSGAAKFDRQWKTFERARNGAAPDNFTLQLVNLMTALRGVTQRAS